MSHSVEIELYLYTLARFPTLLPRLARNGPQSENIA